MNDTTSEELTCGPHTYEGYKIPTGKANLLMIKGSKGFLGCGYFNIEVADKIGEAVALVTGVKSFGDMFNAKVFAVSMAAQGLGIKLGDSGQDALEKLV
jgi:uncharacterized protein YunC (DUF1805 family)